MEISVTEPEQSFIGTKMIILLINFISRDAPDLAGYSAVGYWISGRMFCSEMKGLPIYEEKNMPYRYVIKGFFFKL
jgi:hypothetical protein